MILMNGYICEKNQSVEKEDMEGWRGKKFCKFQTGSAFAWTH